MTNFELKTYNYGPLSGEEPKQLIIMLHGLGADGRDLIGLAPFFAQNLPDAVFVAPDAPYPCDMAPMGYQWFSLQDRSDAAVLAGVQAAAPILDSLITEMMDKYKVTPEKTALIGFSQGSMMSLYVGPRFPQKLAGVLAYSGALIGAEAIDSEGLLKIPVHLVHGEVDDVVPVENYYNAENALKNAGFDVTGGVVQGLSHSIDENGVGSGNEFLQRILN